MIENFTLREMASVLLDLFLPRTCPVCGGFLTRKEVSVCAACLADLPRTGFASMRNNQMSDRFNALIQRDLLSCPSPGGSSFERYVFAAALFFYRPGSGYRRITHRLKYHSDFKTGRYFSRMLGQELARSVLFQDVGAVIPVPLHWSRRWSRGYNQAEIIAQEVALQLGAVLKRDVLVRVRRTKTQTKKSVAEKTANVAGAFKVRNVAGLEGVSHILLVDDVFTTGATLYSCYMAIKEGVGSGVRISIATLACVGR